MKTIKNRLKSLAAAALLTGLAINFNACTEQSPLSAEDNETNVSITALGKKGGKGNDDVSLGGNDKSSVISYPQSASNTFTLKGKGYTGGFVTVPDFAELFVSRNSLTPPPDVPWGQDVTITMTVDRVPGENQLIFSFGPHGCTFSKPAEIYFNWSTLGVDVATLYYIDESGAYIEQLPDDINLQGKWMSLYVDHFSRYALAWSN